MAEDVDNTIIANYLLQADLAFEAMLEFCHKVERGQARSVATYKEFREILIAAGRYEPYQHAVTE